MCIIGSDFTLACVCIIGSDFTLACVCIIGSKAWPTLIHTRAPEVKAPRDPVLRLADIQKPLTKESYKDKFGKLLLWEENEQRLALRRG